jgi:NADH-quinone oxidoreductase subunit F
MPKRLRSPKDLESLYKELNKNKDNNKPLIVTCGGTGCHAYGCAKTIEAIKSELQSKGIEEKIDLKITGCHGFCERGPVVQVQPRNIFYQKVKPEDVGDIVASVLQNSVVERLLYTDTVSGQKVINKSDIPFYSKQESIIFGNNGDLDPTNIEDYFRIGGYSALVKALFHKEREDIIQDIKKSGLRGRGGGGFPTGQKWESCYKAQGDIKYCIVNADEGDPGAYANRSLLEGNPHSVLEGLIIGAYAIGSKEGYFYIRNEYPLAVLNVIKAIDQAKTLGLLGKNILGSGFDFNVRIVKGGGAFVCGESTALMASLEGKVGEPRAKYVHTVEKGLWNKPSDLNNVETWANIPLIINKGYEWFNTIGSASNSGTKIFSLTGKVNNTGLVEVPMGIKLRDIIFNIGGGIRGGKKFKAVQTGGPSGGCLPESMLDLPVDFDELTKVGSMMGSGGMIVMDEGNCMVDVARYFLSFLEEESCGKCVPCREGVKRMRQILNDITSGKGKESDLDLLKETCSCLKDSSLCQLGASAPNPVLTTMKYFREEYEEHILQKKCRAGVCKKLIKFSIIEEKCPGCGLCVKACPAGAITSMGKKNPVVMDPDKCTKCRTCYEVCKMGAIKIE